MPEPQAEVKVTLPLPTPLLYDTEKLVDPLPETVLVAGETLLTLPVNDVVIVRLLALV